MILGQLQGALEDRYDLVLDYRVEQFVSHDASWCEAVTGTQPQSDEMLLLREEDDILDVTLYLSEALMQSSEAPSAIPFNTWCTLLEGVSHFVYVTWNATHHRRIRPIDMELQAEVDKFVFAAFGNRQLSDGEDLDALIMRLFDHVSWVHPEDPELEYRYQRANGLARQYCRWLPQRFAFAPDNRDLYAELARFYRLDGASKIRHITQTIN